MEMTEKATASKIDSFSVPDDGEIIDVFSLHLRGTTVHLSSIGATVLKFVTNSQGGNIDIVTGYKDAKIYHDTGNPHFFNGIVGRVANRIAGGKFKLNKKSYSIYTNDPPNTLHGGKSGILNKIWDGQIIRGGSAIQFSLQSPDGEEGFPGNVMIAATYSLRPSFSSSGVVLQLEMSAELIIPKDMKKDPKIPETPINLTNHSYFNLGDRNNGILDHTLKLESDSYTPFDEHSIPTREVQSLNDDDVMDLRWEQKLWDSVEKYGVMKMNLTEDESKENLSQRQYSSLLTPYGFDHNYVVRNQPGTSLPKVATLTYKERSLSIYSDAPGVQVYTANHLGNSKESSSVEFCKAEYKPWEAICIEPQHFPDSICKNNIVPEGNREFWSGRCPILTKYKPTYHHTIAMRLEVDHSTAETAYCGSDTDGRKYSSIEEMWKAQDLSTWYTRAKGWYENNCDTTIDGVLGGIGHISGTDLEGSRAFLNKLDLPSMPDGKSSLACECGAGIGRVTKGLLLDFADRCDLVESSSRLLFSAPEHIGDSQSHKCRFFCTELQDWAPAANRYSIIWVQWALCYLTDFDIVRFLRRCSEGLVEGGWIILKENTCEGEAFVVDVDDASITRSLEYWLDLIAKSGLQVKRLEWQDDFPDDIFPVPMIAIQI